MKKNKKIIYQATARKQKHGKTVQNESKSIRIDPKMAAI